MDSAQETRPNSIVASVWTALQFSLESAERRIEDEIRAYPRPIPACDQQFNYLLEQRSRVTQELSRLGTVRAESLQGSDSTRLVEQFIESSSAIPAELKESLRTMLR